MSLKLQNILLKLANDVLDLDKSGKTLGEPIDEAEQAILDLLDKRLEEMFDRQTYENKESRKYFQPSYVPQRAHKNGYKLAVRELRANVRKVIKEEL